VLHVRDREPPLSSVGALMIRLREEVPEIERGLASRKRPENMSV
jgi:hypothetical protein